MAGEQYEFVWRRFSVPPDATSTGPVLFDRLLEEIGSMRNRVILLDNFIESLPDPGVGEPAASDRRWILKELNYEVRTGRLPNRLRSNRSVLLIASRSCMDEDCEELQETQSHYYLRPPETDMEREEVDKLRQFR